MMGPGGLTLSFTIQDAPLEHQAGAAEQTHRSAIVLGQHERFRRAS
jgi:hypothetical protein